jgi:Fe-Mn family superoxide dismutase
MTGSRFALPPLPYAEAALTSVIDAETMALHHGRHHKAYVDKLNAAIAERPSLAGQSLEALLARAGSLHADVRNNAGQHWNHSFFWETMAPPGTGSEPEGALLEAIRRDFGGLSALVEAFNAAGEGHFGSGWAWLVRAGNGRLVVGTTADEQSPLMEGAALAGTPLLVNDLWEHAFYLGYRNRKGDYLAAWWKLVNWPAVAARFAAAQAPGKGRGQAPAA